ncbi:unnamed protein product, partial [Ilex paraguariensis]
ALVPTPIPAPTHVPMPTIAPRAPMSTSRPAHAPRSTSTTPVPVPAAHVSVAPILALLVSTSLTPPLPSIPLQSNPLKEWNKGKGGGTYL